MLPFNSPNQGEKVFRIKDGVEVEVKGYNSDVGIQGIFKVFDLEADKTEYLFSHEFIRDIEVAKNNENNNMRCLWVSIKRQGI